MSSGKMSSIKKYLTSCRLFTVPALCLCLFLVTLPQTSCAPTTPKPTENITVTVPEGTQSYGNSNLLCTPTRWTDVAIFFLANYVAHAATIKSLPGQPTLATLLVHVAALMFPLAGIIRGVRAIRQFAIVSDTPLKTAAKAEALCVVIRTAEWMPQRGDVVCVSEIQFQSQARRSAQSRIDREELFFRIKANDKANDRSFLPSNNSSKIEGRQVHGICCLPHGYALAIIPPGARIMELCEDQREELEATCIPSWSQRLKDALKMQRRIRSRNDDFSNPDTLPEFELSSNYNLPKCVVAIFQTLYASATLYETKGDQIQRYGYAAFGLTVAPYLVMSIINLFGTMVTPDYPCVYLVRSEVMDEASRRDGAKFEGMVATLRSDPRKVWHYVEFTIDENDRIFIRSPRESISQRGLHDATNVVQREISPSTISPRDVRSLTSRQRASYLARESCLLISESPGFDNDPPSRTIVDQITHFAGLIVGLIPIAINGGLSHFDAGQSTIAQRVWTMTWLAFGWFMGITVDTSYSNEVDVITALFFAPAIGGFVVVAQMLMSYGRCVAIDEANF